MTSTVGTSSWRESQALQARYLFYRIRVAATGVVLAAGLFAVTQPDWVKDGSYSSWQIWQLASADNLALWTCFVLVATLVLAVIAAIEARFGLAVVTAVVAAGLFALVLAVGANERKYGFSTTAAWNEGWLFSALLGIWAAIVARIARLQRDQHRKTLYPV